MRILPRRLPTKDWRSYVPTAIAVVAVLLAIVSAARAQNLGEPAFSATTLQRTAAALERYRDLAARGGWPRVPDTTLRAKEGDRGLQVTALKDRLVASGDMTGADAAAGGDLFDAATRRALERFQARHGLSTTGQVGNLTIRALNVPIERRLVAMSATLERMRHNGFVFPQRYVVVNIPAASVEAVEDGIVERRHVAVVGRIDRQSPTLQTVINSVTLNPTWTAPISIVRNDIAPRVRQNLGYLAENNMRLFGAGGQEIHPSQVDWSARAINFTLRQDPGPSNALGFVRIDMPNRQAVYLHDTPRRELFRSDVRFHSSGCARVEGIRDLAAWLLEGTAHDRARIDRDIAEGATRVVRLTRPVPVVWVYLTAWASSDGTVQFRDDIYENDNAEGIAETIIPGAPQRPGLVPATQPAVTSSAGAFHLQSAAPTPAPRAPNRVSSAWALDSR